MVSRRTYTKRDGMALSYYGWALFFVYGNFPCDAIKAYSSKESLVGWKEIASQGLFLFWEMGKPVTIRMGLGNSFP